MDRDALSLSPWERLHALRKLDSFHHWESIDDRRYCRRCGKIITGRQIRVFGGRRTDQPSRLECPSEGCLSVPFDWIVPDLSVEAAAVRPTDPLLSEAVPTAPSLWSPLPKRSRIFGFLSAPHVFF
jgi:hypothetical protein